MDRRPYWKEKCEHCIYATNVVPTHYTDRQNHHVLTTYNWDCDKFKCNIHFAKYYECDGPYCAMQAMLHAEEESA